MEGSESSRSRSKRDVEDSVDARGSWKDDEEREDVDGRKNRSGKSRKHSYADEVEELDDSSRRSSADRNESTRKSVTSSSRAYSGDEDDYDVRRESRMSKVPRRSPEERSERRSSDGYKDRDVDSIRRRREDEDDWDSSRRSSSRTSGHDVSHSKSRSKTDGSFDDQHERQQEKDIRSSEGRESSREKQGHRDQEEKSYQRRVDEAYTNRRADGTGSDRPDTRDGRSSSDQSKHRNAREVHDDRNELGERWEDTEKRKGSARIEKNDQDRRSVDPRCDTGSYVAREDKPGRVDERPAGSVDDIGQSTSNHSAKPEENDEKLRHQVEGAHENNNNVGTKNKLPYLDEDGRALLRDGSNKEARHDKKYHRERDGGDRGHSDSDNERSISMNEKTREDSHGDYKSYRGRGRNRELEGSKEYWRNRQRQDSKEANDYDAVTEWRHGQERLDGGNFHGCSGYRKDSRGRYESSKGPSSYGNRYDSSDSIEIRPNRNLDFGRESSVSGKRTEMGSHQDLTSGTNYPPDENKRNYGNGEDSQERYYDDTQNMDQNTGKNPTDSQTGRGGLKGATTSNTSGAGQSSSGSMISPIPQQGPKGGRPSRGPRGRLNGRDPQRMGVPVPMMPPPPFGPLGLPRGPMQPLGPSMSHSPGPLGPGIFMPPFPGSLVWPGARGVDVSMLAVPPYLPIPPPVAGPSFTPSVGVDPNHNIHLNQTGTGRGAPTNASGSGFSPIATPSHEMMHDKPPAVWTPQRNSGPAGKAPSRGEQNDYSQNFVDTGMRPQNFIRELELTSVVEDYPKLRELIQRKDEIVSNSASAPMYYKCDLKEHTLPQNFLAQSLMLFL